MTRVRLDPLELANLEAEAESALLRGDFAQVRALDGLLSGIEGWTRSEALTGEEG